MPKSKLTEAERKELFSQIAKQFEKRDILYAKEIQHYINAIVESDDSLGPIEIALLAGEVLNFAGELSATLQPFRHSLDWLGFATRLVSVMQNSASEVRRIAHEAGVEMNDEEAIRDLKNTASSEVFDSVDFGNKTH